MRTDRGKDLGIGSAGMLDAHKNLLHREADYNDRSGNKQAAQKEAGHSDRRGYKEADYSHKQQKEADYSDRRAGASRTNHDAMYARRGRANADMGRYGEEFGGINAECGGRHGGNWNDGSSSARAHLLDRRGGYDDERGASNHAASLASIRMNVADRRGMGDDVSDCMCMCVCFCDIQTYHAHTCTHSHKYACIDV